MSRFIPHWFVGALIVSALVIGAGCSNSSSSNNSENLPSGTSKGSATLSGAIAIDGSSTVFPVATAIVEGFNEKNPNVKITANQAGTGAGMQKFGRKEIDIATASRPIKEKELADCKTAGVDFVELPIAFDGLSIVVNKANNWLTSITIEDLHKIWDKDSKVKSWKDVNPAWPDKPIKLYGPTTAHGTYEFFNEAVNGKKDNSRQDYQQCADYNVLVAGVSKDESSLGYVGFAYYEQNKDNLKLIPVGAGAAAVAPSAETIQGGQYVPLSRPLLVYVNKVALERPEVSAFMDYVVSSGKAAVESQGYVPLPDDVMKMVTDRLKAKTLGTAFAGFKPGMRMQDVLKAESKN